MDINYVDILFLLILIISVLFAFSRGIVKEIFSTGNWIISGWLAFKYYLEIQPYFLEYISIVILFAIFKLLGYRISSEIGYYIGKTFGPFFRSKNLISLFIKR